ncbi:hypothetical protein L596_015932 [Steinernema carpocapsae]|uniref:G-protein coupled receptors family 1 profile domain-containing protein n=1 Tax=Steinernema carpocapsae TaxID=34508 RepID=A0A4V6XW92_STECR|nr:hypothetical protein L596_015932 [Steinernema carpocapsae]
MSNLTAFHGTADFILFLDHNIAVTIGKLIVGFVGAILNSVIIIVLWRSPTLKQDSFTLLLTVLCGSEIVLGLAGVPRAVVTAFLTERMTKFLCMAMGSLYVYGDVATSTAMSGIAIARFNVARKADNLIVPLDHCSSQRPRRTSRLRAAVPKSEGRTSRHVPPSCVVAP